MGEQHHISVKMSVSADAPCLGVAIVSNPNIHLVQIRRQHGEQTGDVGRRPLHHHTLLPAHKHCAAIGLFSQVGPLNGENPMSCADGKKKRKKENGLRLDATHDNDSPVNQMHI